MTKKTQLYIKVSIALAAVIVLACAAVLRHPDTLPGSEHTQAPTDTSSADIAATTPKTTDSSSAAHRSTQKTVETATVQRDHIVTSSNQSFPLRTYKTLANDPGSSQWWTQRTGLETAWTYGAGPRQTTVAVIDTGFALKHEEFAGRWARNVGEEGATTQQSASKKNCTDQGVALTQACNLIDDDYDGIVDNEPAVATSKQNPSRLNCTDQGISLDKSCNLIDDDGNGYVDDVQGWDFANYDNNVQAGEINPDGESTTHGTEVSGVLGATGNNSKGIAGVNWSTKILPLQAIDDDGYGDTLTVSRAIRYAADRNVDVISLSLGTSAEDPYLRQAIKYALDKGAIVVAASGNDGCDCISYPARYPEVIAVGAESAQGGPDSFSSYGSALDVLAPGDNIQTSTWSKSNPTSAYVSGVAGTSFATPYISGLLALARSYQPDASWAELSNALLAQARHTGLSAANPYSTTLGFGYAQANTLINRVKSTSSPQIRYYFSPLSSAQPLTSTNTYQCRGSDFPTAPVFQLSKGGSTRYTISQLEQSQATSSGWSVKRLMYSCVGLSTDTPAMSRSINLLTEVGSGGKPTPTN